MAATLGHGEIEAVQLRHKKRCARARLARNLLQQAVFISARLREEIDEALAASDAYAPSPLIVEYMVAFAGGPRTGHLIASDRGDYEQWGCAARAAVTPMIGLIERRRKFPLPSLWPPSRFHPAFFSSPLTNWLS